MNLLGKLWTKSAPLGGDFRLAVIANWNQRCGISTYTNFLVEELRKIVPNIKVFSERNPIEELNVDSDEVVYCWERNGSVKQLKKEIRKYDPDAILIQHEYGIFPTVVCWYNLLNFVQDYRYAVTLHSVYEHRDKFLCESPLNNVIVHTQEAADLLRKKGYANRLDIIPHGCPPPCSERNHNLYGTPHTLMQYGFAFPYKNFEDSILAVHRLKQLNPEKYHNVYLTCYLSENPNTKAIHDSYYEKLKALVKDHELEENVGLIRGFLSQKQLVEALKTNQICVLPYKSHPEHQVYGSSGASKIAMAHRIPLIVGDCHLFDDVRAAQIPCASDADGIADIADKMFSDWKVKKAVIDRQIAYCTENSWANVAQAYLKILRP